MCPTARPIAHLSGLSQACVILLLPQQRFITAIAFCSVLLGLCLRVWLHQLPSVQRARTLFGRWTVLNISFAQTLLLADRIMRPRAHRTNLVTTLCIAMMWAIITLFLRLSAACARRLRLIKNKSV